MPVFDGSQPGHSTDAVRHTSGYKNLVHSLSFEPSFVIIGKLQWPHGQTKSASKLSGHPVFNGIARMDDA